jgi:hypothetical protein
MWEPEGSTKTGASLCNVLPLPHLCTDAHADTSHHDGAWRRIITIDFKPSFTENPPSKLPNERALNIHIHSDMECWADVLNCHPGLLLLVY